MYDPEKYKVYMTVKEAQNYAKNLGISISVDKIRKLCQSKKLGGLEIGHQLNNRGKYFINIRKFKRALRGNYDNQSSSKNQKDRKEKKENAK